MRNTIINFLKSKKIITALILFLGVILLSLTYFSMRQNIFIADLNQPVLDWMINQRNPMATDIFQFITTVFDPQSFALLMVGATILWIMKSHEQIRPLLFAAAIGLSATISSAIKLLTANSRPPIETMITPYELDFSFPSGHTLIITVVVLTLGYLIRAWLQEKKLLTVYSVVGFILILLVTSSRLYLGYHWLTDIVASIGLGLIVFSTVILIDIFCLKYFKKLK